MSGAGRTTARRRGLCWCAASILLVTLAQLCLKQAVSHLPPLSPEAFLRIAAHADPPLIALLLFGLAAYTLSMLCWFFALRRLPLSYAYPMLSISYASVCLLAALLPWFAEPATMLKAAGVILIMVGVRLIHTAEK